MRVRVIWQRREFGLIVHGKAKGGRGVTGGILRRSIIEVSADDGGFVSVIPQRHHRLPLASLTLNQSATARRLAPSATSANTPTRRSRRRALTGLGRRLVWRLECNIVHSTGSISQKTSIESARTPELASWP